MTFHAHSEKTAPLALPVSVLILYQPWTGTQAHQQPCPLPANEQGQEDEHFAYLAMTHHRCWKSYDLAQLL